MKDTTRVVLVDPSVKSRQELQRLLGTFAELELVEVCPTYQPAARRVAAHTPEIVLVVTDDDEEQALELIRAVAAHCPGAAVLAASADNDAASILRCIRAGAREFLPLPAPTAEIADAVRRLCPKAEIAATGPRGPQTIAVTGAAGGVGCSSLASNLAATLAKVSRRDTVLVDFDLLLGSLEECLAVIPDNSLEILVRNVEEFDPSMLKRWLPRHPSGLYVLPHPVSMEESARLDPDGLQRVLALLKKSFDSIIIDTSKGLQASDFLAFEMADVILVVLQLNLNCTRNTVRLLQYFRMFDGFAEKIRLVVNRVNSPLSEISVRKAEELLKTEVSWEVQNATKLFRPARSLGVPIDEIEGGATSKAYEGVLAIVRELLPYPVDSARVRKRLFSSFR